MAPPPVYGQDQLTYWYGLVSSGLMYVLGVSDPTILLPSLRRWAIRYHWYPLMSRYRLSCSTNGRRA